MTYPQMLNEPTPQELDFDQYHYVADSIDNPTMEMCEICVGNINKTLYNLFSNLVDSLYQETYYG
jgi:hypothetical protein